MVESCCIQQIFIELPEIAGIESSDFLKAEKAVNHKDQPLRIVIYPKTNIPLPTITHYSLLFEFFPIVYFQIVFISFFSSNGFDKCSFIPASLLCFLSSRNAFAVIAKIGIVFASCRSSDLIVFVAVSPSITGIIISMRITSK